MTTDPTPPRLTLPRYHVWLATEPAADPAYVGVVTVRNIDQLTAETQSKGLGIRLKEQPFHLTNLWLWAALTRQGLTTDRFHALVQHMEYRPVDDTELEGGEDDEDPTDGAETLNTG